MQKKIVFNAPLPAWFIMILLVITAYSLWILILLYQARQQPLGTLKGAAPLLVEAWDVSPESAFSLQDFLNDGLARRFSPTALRAVLPELTHTQDPAQVIFTDTYKRGTNKSGDGVVYYETSEALIQSHWGYRYFWSSPLGPINIRWKMNNICVVDRAVKRTTKAFLSALYHSPEAAFTFTLDHAYPRRPEKWITVSQLQSWQTYFQKQEQDKSATSPTFLGRVRFKDYQFLSIQNWNEQQVQLSFSANGYGPSGCRLRLAKIEKLP